MEPRLEPYEAKQTRNCYFRVTLRNTVESLSQLHAVRNLSIDQLINRYLADDPPYQQGARRARSHYSHARQRKRRLQRSQQQSGED